MAVDTTTIGISLLSSILAGVVVAILNHLLTLRLEKKRDAKKRLDDLNIQRRISAWKSLEKAATVDDEDYDIDTKRKLKDEFDSAFAEIILLGTEVEINLAIQYAKLNKCALNWAFKVFLK